MRARHYGATFPTYTLDINIARKQKVKTIKNFYVKNNNSSNAFAALLDILDNSKIKYKKLKKDHEEIIENKTALQQCVERIILNLKNKTISESGKNKTEYCIYLSKDDRKKFIDNIMTDEEILRIFQDDTLPTINIIDRKIQKI